MAAGTSCYTGGGAATGAAFGRVGYAPRLREKGQLLRSGGRFPSCSSIAGVPEGRTDETSKVAFEEAAESPLAANTFSSDAGTAAAAVIFAGRAEKGNCEGETGGRPTSDIEAAGLSYLPFGT